MKIRRSVCLNVHLYLSTNCCNLVFWNLCTQYGKRTTSGRALFFQLPSIQHSSRLNINSCYCRYLYRVLCLNNETLPFSHNWRDPLMLMFMFIFMLTFIFMLMFIAGMRLTSVKWEVGISTERFSLTFIHRLER